MSVPRTLPQTTTLSSFHTPFPRHLSLSILSNTPSGRGPLPGKGWNASAAVSPKMCAYKTVRSHFKIFGLQGTVEGKIRDSQRGIFCKTLCQAYSTIDAWFDKAIADIRAMEAEVASKTEAAVLRLRAKGEAPPLATDGYWLARTGAGAGAASAGGAAGGAGAAPTKA